MATAALTLKPDPPSLLIPRNLRNALSRSHARSCIQIDALTDLGFKEKRGQKSSAVGFRGEARLGAKPQ